MITVARAILSCVTASLALTLTGCRQAETPARHDDTVRLRVMVLREETVRQPILASGILTPKTEMKLAFKTGGIIREMYVGEGQSLKKSGLMASLDLSEIRAEVSKAKLAVEKAGRDFVRVSNLFRDSVATLEQYQDAQTALELARWNREIADFNLEHSVIRAPADGKVLKKMMEPGELVSPGMPVFLFASTENSWVVNVNLADVDIVRISLNDSVSLRFDAYPGISLPGSVSGKSAVADPYTGTFRAEIRMEEMPANLMAGLFARAEIFPGKGGSGIRIPPSALIQGSGMEGFVYVIEEKRPVKRKIVLGRILDQGMLVKTGLQPGDSLVTEGGHFLLENSRIEIIPQ